VRRRSISLLTSVVVSISLAVPTLAADEAADQTSMSTAAEMPSSLEGLEVDVVRSGIYRVLDDGAGHALGRLQQVDIGPDGTVWAATRNGDVFQLGEPGVLDPSSDGGPYPVHGLAVLEDGTVAVHDDRRVSSWDGSTWSTSTLRHDAQPVIERLEGTRQGELWALLRSHEGPEGPVVARLGSEAEFFTPSDLGLESARSFWAHSLAVTPDGTPWLSLGGRPDLPAGLVRFDGQAWSPVDPFGDGEPYAASDLQVEPDGSLSATLHREKKGFPKTGRWDGSTWTVGRLERADAARPGGPDRSKWPDRDWLRWWPQSGPVDPAFPGPFIHAEMTERAFAPDGSEWMMLSMHGDGPKSDRPASGLYVIDREAAAKSLPKIRVTGRQGLVPLLHPKFAAQPGGDGNRRAKWAQKMGTDIVAEVFGIGDVWYAGLDSVGGAGDRWIKNNSRGSGPTPRAAIKDALLKEKNVTFPSRAAKSALLQWPPKKKN
jgi:hypothetical protein